MNGHIYKIIELAGTSEEGIEKAVENALSKASKSVRNMRWLQVIDTRAHIDNQKIQHWQVIVKVGFTLED